MISGQMRQGDVLLQTVTRLPGTAVKQTKCVLAYGEVTNHSHQITEQAFLWIDTDGTRYVEVYGCEATVEHEEHGPIVLPGPAIYLVTIQREYHPDELRNVAD